MLNFFCQIVDDVIAIKAIIVAIKPKTGISVPKSKPKTRIAPINPRIAILGFIGAILVLGLDLGTDIPVLGLIATIIALIAITSSTIWQKKLSNNLPLPISNFYQAVGGCLFHTLIVIFFTKPYIDFNKTFFLAMSHQIFLVSFGAFTILMFLIKRNSASKTVSIFFLIPAVSAFMGWFFLDEILTKIDLIGFFIATLGVYIATRK